MATAFDLGVVRRGAEALADELGARQRIDGSWSNPATEMREDDPVIARPFATAALPIALGDRRRASQPRLIGYSAWLEVTMRNVMMLVVVVLAGCSEMKKAKKSEADLQLRHMEAKLKSYYIEKLKLPPSSTLSLPGPDGGACAGGTNKMPAVSQSAWNADPAWKALFFHIDEDALFTYHWTRTSDKAGYATAVGDLDCDGTMTTYRLDIEADAAVDGNLKTTYLDPTPD